MNYLVAADSNDWDAKVSKRFIHAKTYMIVDTDTEEISAYDSVSSNDPFEVIDRHKQNGLVSGIITCNIGPHAFELAAQRRLPVYLLRNVTVRRAIELIKEGKVEPAESSSLRRSIQEGRHRQQPISESIESGQPERLHQGKGKGLGQGRGRFRRFR